MKNRSHSQKTLNLWAIILIVWSFYRIYFKLPEWFDEFIAKPIVFILPVYIYITQFERKNFLEGLNWKIKSSAKDYILGGLIGLIFIGMALLSSFVKGKPLSVVLPLTSIPLIILIAFATSISEEILSRGFVLKRLYKESKNVFTSSFLSSFLFFFLHVPILFTNARITGNMIFFFMFTDLILSLAVSFFFIERKNLTVAILIHAFYNLTLYLFV